MIWKVDPASNFQAADRGRRGFLQICLEALLVAALGLLFAVTANWISPRGLVLGRNYFPDGSGTNSAIAPRPYSGASQGAQTNTLSGQHQIEDQIKTKGLQVADAARVQQLFHDPRYEQGLVIFLDARDEEHYRAGHIPGAYECDPYRTEKFFPTIFPRCQTAEEIVVYCNGGECEDSQFAAIGLRDAGVAGQKLFIYAGGIAEWIANKLPLEVGEPNSGVISNASPALAP